MRVVNNTTTSIAKRAHYGSAVRRPGDNTSLFIVVDMFTGDKNVRLVNLATGCIVKVPDEEELTLVENAFVEVEHGHGFI